MLRVPRTRLLSSARKSYSRWDFLSRVEVTPPREARSPPPPLPSPKYLDVRGRCTLEYVDIPPLEEAFRGHEAPVTIVLVHSAPGSYNDFRHLIPVLDRHPHVRIIGLNLPGYAGSDVAQEHYLESISALPTAALTLEAVQKLCVGQEGSDKVFLVGHSFGAHTVINMAALQATETHQEAPFKLLGFPRDAPLGHYVAGLVRAGTTDFRVVREQVEMLRGLKFPALVAWSQNDEFMEEEEIPVELAGLCHAGPRLAFAGGGHNVQKTRAEQVASAMTRWIEGVLAEDGEAEQLPTRLLP